MSLKGSYHTMKPPEERYNFLIIGKTGNGKSSLGNAILGTKAFRTGCSMGSTTENSSYAENTVLGNNIRVVDTPDLDNSQLSEIEKRDEVIRWRSMATNTPSLVLLAIRCDVRYTAEEYAIYKHMERLWGDNWLRQHLVVAFTFGDRQDRDIREELKTVCPELKSVLHDANNRYIVFDGTEHGSMQGLYRHLLGHMTDIRRRERTPPSACPKSLLPICVAVVVIAAVCCIIFASLRITAGAIVFGLVGLAVAVGAVILIRANRKNATIF